jgi:rSAM/selenodomain-associated transferase 2
MEFSIIIPVLNEEKAISTCLEALQKFRQQCEIIVVDGGSVDRTYQMAGPLADKVIRSLPGRAKQMNQGAASASANVLIFLHADTFLPDQAFKAIEEGLQQGYEWGRFDIRLSGQSCLFTIIATLMNWRSALTGIATGDQAIFVTRRLFEQIDGYPDIALMEDLAVCKILKTTSPPLCLKNRVQSSGRRWQNQGIMRTILLMWWLRLRFFLGDNPAALAPLYREGRFWKT